MMRTGVGLFSQASSSLTALGILLASVMVARPVLAVDSGPYQVQIEQVDTREFPLVTLYVAVTDPVSGEIVTGLAQDQFTVAEDGKAVEIVEFSAGNSGPISTVLTIDRSGSMGVEGKMAGAKEAAHAFIDLMRPQDRAALVVFDDTVTIWQEFTSDQSHLRQRIDAVAIGGCTAWYDGVWQTADLMAGVGGRRNAILLSDGIDCREGDFLQNLLGGSGSQHSLNEAIQHAREADVVVHTIGLGRQATTEVSEEGFDEEKLRRMAEETGGTYHHAPTASQLRALYESFAESTQKEYVITVKSGRASYDGTRRDLKVDVGSSTGSGVYVEQHLLNVQSNPWVALALAMPLALLFFGPMTWRRFRRLDGGSQVYAAGPDQTPMPVVACQYCWRPIRAGARFCPSCGRTQPTRSAVTPNASFPTPSTGICGHCGHSLRQNAQFCSSCGQRILQ